MRVVTRFTLVSHHHRHHGHVNDGFRRSRGRCEPAARQRPLGRYRRPRHVVLPADGAGRERATVGQLCRPLGPRAGEPDGRAVPLLVAAAGRARSLAARPRRPRGHGPSVRGRPADVLPAAVDHGRRAPHRSGRANRLPGGRGQHLVQHRVGHAPPVTADVQEEDEDVKRRRCLRARLRCRIIVTIHQSCA